MTGWRFRRLVLSASAAAILACPGPLTFSAQMPDSSSIIQHIDASVKERIDDLAGYTVTEHYAVYRNKDESHPVAEMLVKTLYNKATGKSYSILSQSGSKLIRSLVLNAILDTEKRLNEPGNREGSWITSANYEMNVKSGGTQMLDGRECLVVSITPRRKAPYLIEGIIWVDARDYSIVQLQGTSSQSPSIFTGPTQVMRQYTEVNGFAEATHARAV
jgi:outer membrane lipoprotein-sorting protein